MKMIGPVVARGAKVMGWTVALCLLWAATARAADLAPGLEDLRTGIEAYGDLYHWAFYNPAGISGQISSHDERDMNIDLGHFHGHYRGDPILADIPGPGVVYRIWSARATGTLRFHADGAERPVLQCDFMDYVLGARGADPAFAVGRYANYTPIYFLDRLIITARNFNLTGAFYQISYMTFDHDLGFTPLAPGGPVHDPDQLAAAQNFWTSNGERPGRDPGGVAQREDEVLELAPSGQDQIELPGAGLITAIKLADPAAAMDPLEDLAIKIYWDGDPEPAVDSPADAFFLNRFDPRAKSRTAAKTDYQAFETMLVTANNNGYSARWPMPFARGARIVLENHGEKQRLARLIVEYRAADRLPDNAMRFHALYRQVDYPEMPYSRQNVFGLFYRVDQETNYVVLERQGKGYYVGCFLYVAAAGPDWWGEGDEMIWVDGEEKARIRGTGTEDEFNWSWGFDENRSPVSGVLLAQRPHGGSPRSDVGNNVAYRYRPGDYIRFEDQIKVTYERLGTVTGSYQRYPGAQVNTTHERGDDYSSVAFWYELP